ncbi:MAG: putative toxin-antitoxin system toxin component, PIN family [Caldiserica bacterium]|nr:putative toxin-antitoxin system toxin component, PIN family [Caldisericota bacterium]
MKFRIVLDTNIVISALLFSRRTGLLVNYWKEKKFIFLLSREVLEEYIRVLSYPKFNLKEEEIKFLIQREILPYVEITQVKSRVEMIKDDPEDNKFLSLGVDGKADYIVSGDSHLLSLGNYSGVEIISLNTFLEKLSNE